jgi:hypothetical protein
LPYVVINAFILQRLLQGVNGMMRGSNSPWCWLLHSCISQIKFFIGFCAWFVVYFRHPILFAFFSQLFFSYIIREAVAVFLNIYWWLCWLSSTDCLPEFLQSLHLRFLRPTCMFMLNYNLYIN